MPEYWYAFTVKPHKERAACLVAERLGLVGYFPTEKRKPHRRSKRGPESTDKPIVTGVVFVALPHRATPYDLHALIRPLDRYKLSPFIRAHGPTDGEPSEIPYQQIEDMVQRNQDLAELALARARGELTAFEAGERVRVTQGPLTGFSGLVRECKGYRAQLVLDMLGAVDVSVDHLMAAE